SKLQVTQDKLLLQWQRDFDGRQWNAASADYKQIMASKNQDAMARVGTEYRKLLSSLVERSNRSCSASEAEKSAIRSEIAAGLPKLSCGEDFGGQLKLCRDPDRRPAPTLTAEAVTPPAAQPSPARDAVKPAAPPNACVEMQAQLALARLKTRVDPT